MSRAMAAVLDGPMTTEDTGEWVELDDGVVMPTSRQIRGDLIELEPPPVEYSSQHAMRFGPRAYTARQAQVIDLAVRRRRPLNAPPLQLGD